MKKDAFTAKVQALGRITIPVEARDVLSIGKGSYVHCIIEKYTEPKKKDYTYAEYE